MNLAYKILIPIAAIGISLFAYSRYRSNKETAAVIRKQRDIPSEGE